MTSIKNELVKQGDYVIVKTDSVLRLVRLDKKKPQFLLKRKINLCAAIGHSFGSFFEIKQNGDLLKVSNSETLISVRIDSPEEEEGESKDNRSLFDNGNNQRLTTGDIETFKASGMSGQEVVKRIVENSTSFKEKTAFAKEKYLKKKQKKYLKYIKVLKPNVRLLADMYNTQAPLKICNLRMDSLSQMIAFCNVMSGGRYMVVENVMDLLVTAVLDKLGAEGCVVQLHMNPFSVQPNPQIVQALTISEEQLQSILYNIDLKTAVSLLEGDFPSSEGQKKKAQVEAAKSILKTKSLDGLLVAMKNHPANVLCLLDFLSDSRPFAIFSMYQEPLVDCYVKLKARGDIILLNITDTWLRKFQVMPERTHPCYTMRSHGGFLLTGLKVALKPKP